MGVFIKEMEMPKGCRDCRLLHQWDDERYHCPFVSYLQWVEYDDIEDYIISDDCPLVEVKTPHGDLIDTNALARKIVESNYGVDFINKTTALIMDASTVIEAEVE